jgi:hypothetical protein
MLISVFSHYLRKILSCFESSTSIFDLSAMLYLNCFLTNILSIFVVLKGKMTASLVPDFFCSMFCLV